MKRWLMILFVLLLAACGGGGEAEVTDYELDAETGLPLNPEPLPNEGSFVVEGTIINMNLTPQTAPEFVVRVPSGKTFRIRSQGLDAITYDDGEAIPLTAFTQGMVIRATVDQTEADQGSGDIGILRSDNLTVERQE